MIEFFYTILLLGICIGMFLYSRSVPVALFSVYTASWFFPQGIPLYGIPLALNSLIAGAEFLYVFLYYHELEEVQKRLFRTVLSFVIGIIFVFMLVALFSTKIPLMDQINIIKTSIYYSLNFFIVIFFNKESEFTKYINLVGFLVLISGIYGVYTYIIAQNPFGDFMMLYMRQFEDQGLNGDFIESERGFLSSRIFGFTVHPLMFGGIISLSTYLFIQRFIYLEKKIAQVFLLMYIVWGLLLIVLTGSRSILIGTIFGLMFFFIKSYPQKSLIYVSIFLLVILFGGLTIEDDFLRSIFFFWQDHDEIEGSSSEMRVSQFFACIEVVSKDLMSWLFGLGHNWSGMYLNKNGNIPPFQGFESILFTKIVNYGILGTFLYFLFCYLPLFKAVNKYVSNEQTNIFIMSFAFLGLTIALFTGEYYGYRWYLVTIFFLINYNIIHNNTIEKDNMQTR